MMRWCCIVSWLPHFWGEVSCQGLVGSVAARGAGVVPRGLRAFSLVFPGPWAVWDLCGVGLGVS